MADVEVRVLGAADLAELERFLGQRASTSMFLRSNLRHAGIVDEGKPLQATYVGSWKDGRLAAVAAHCWNGKLLLQGESGLEACARSAAEETGRRVNGLLGPWTAVERTRAALGLDSTPVTHASREDLFELSLDQLRVPGALAFGAVHCRHARADELRLLTAWRVAYKREAMGESDHGSAAVDVERARQDGTDWVLEAAGEPVAFSTFNARLPDVVQVGGVWTPPELRARGYARGVVAGSLLEAQSGGASRAILFTAVDNHPARRAYLALGFKLIGDYGVVMLAPG